MTTKAPAPLAATWTVQDLGSWGIGTVDDLAAMPAALALPGSWPIPSFPDSCYVRRDQWPQLGVSTGAISQITPNFGSLAAGHAVEIYGTGFLGATAVLFGGVAGTALVVHDDTHVSISTPAGAAGVVAVEVDTPSGVIVEPGSFTWGQSPTVTGVNPNAGGVAGGDPVQLAGVRYNQATGPLTGINFGGTPATNLVIVNANTATCDTPPHAAGAVQVQVVNRFGSSNLANGFTYA